MNRRVLARAALALLTLAAAAAQRPITHEDVWLMKRLGSPVASPDGSRLVFAVTQPSYEQKETTTDLWLTPWDGSDEPVRLTAASGSESGPAWSHDGSRLAFSAKRGDDDAAQIYVMPMNRPGEPVRVTALSTGASNPLWSPDGRTLAFTSRVFPDAANDVENAERKKEVEERKEDVSAYEGFPIRAFDEWIDERVTHLLVQPAAEGAEARDLLAGTKLASKPGFRLAGGFDWAPDGESIVFAAYEDYDGRAYSNPQRALYRVSASGGEPERLTEPGASFGSPQFGNDGRLYALRTPLTEFQYNLTRLIRCDRDASNCAVLGEDLDRSVSDYVLAGASDEVFFLADDEGTTRLFRIDGDRAASAVDPDSRGVFTGLTASRSGPVRLAAGWQASASVAEIFALDSETGERRALTAMNQERANELDWQPFREMWITSKKGRRIHSWLALPPDFDETKKYPLLLFIHGGPHSSSKDQGHVRWSAQLMASPGYVVLLTDYTGSVGYGEQFARNIQGDPLRTPGEELLEAADAAIERFPFIDGSRQAAAGASYGGHLVNWLQAVTTDRFRCFVGHAGLVDLEGQWGTSDGIYHRERNNGGVPWGDSSVWGEQSPSTYAANFTTPMLLTIGEKDYRVPINQTLWAYSILQRLQTPSRLLVFHNENHWIMKGPNARRYWDETHAWLSKYLKKAQ